MSQPNVPPTPPDAAHNMSNFDDLRTHVTEARAALAAVAPPLPQDSGNAYAALYYPLLFLTATCEAVLRHMLREAHASVAAENEGAARFLAAARSGGREP